MPSTYAHRCFGADVLTQLPEALQKKIEPYRALYDIGLHGPDLLFYYKALQSNPVNRLGNAMHEQPGTVFFERARGVIRNAKNRDAALVYALGYICHFALDHSCHPYIEKKIKEIGVTHAEIEVEFDRMLLAKRGHNPLTHRLAGHIPTDMTVREQLRNFSQRLQQRKCSRHSRA